MTHLVLVRHGESELNVVNCQQRVFCGQFDTPLTERGRQQAVEAGQQLAALSYLQLHRAISSPLQRARDTLALILPSLPHDIRILPPSAALSERSLGEFQGRSEAEVFRDYPQYRDDERFNRFLRDWDQKAPGGESLGDVTHRIWPAVNELLATDEDDLLLVSHIQALRCLLGRALSLPFDEWTRLPIPNATPLVLRWDGKFSWVKQ